MVGLDFAFSGNFFKAQMVSPSWSGTVEKKERRQSDQLWEVGMGGLLDTVCLVCLVVQGGFRGIVTSSFSFHGAGAAEGGGGGRANRPNEQQRQVILSK